MLSVAVNYIKGEEKLVLIPDENSFEITRTFVNELTKKLASTPKIANKVNIVIDEIYSNIVHYSGADIAEIEYKITEGRLFLTFTDNGTPYNPLEAKTPDITLAPEDREIGGLGIFIVRKMAERMEYKHENGQNILSLVLGLEQ